MSLSSDLLDGKTLDDRRRAQSGNNRSRKQRRELRCAWYPKQALCLQRSFVTTYLLRKHGIAAQMVLGAQKLPFKAHAWVEVDGRAINERSNAQATYAIWDRC